MCGSLVQNVGYLLELTAPTVEAAVAAVTPPPLPALDGAVPL